MEWSGASVWAEAVALLPALLGGIGLFLLGMILMSDGLKAAAGSALREVLRRVTGTPWRAFFSGAGLTALVQSSSATTVTTIGFVSAGLLPFAAALGVIVGANVGTTSTGWIVALLGFKLNVGAAALPLIGIGALMKLLGKGRVGHLGMALAGFGLIFVGIDFLRDGMGGLAQSIDFSGFSHESLWGRLALLGIGALMTVLLQSSSAAVAITLTALFGGAIGLEQAAYLVIGQNLGTTVKAVLASIGASVAARRTALAHILFNVVAALIAVFGFSFLLQVSVQLADWVSSPDPALILTVFHTLFNLLGALVFMAFLGAFARLIARVLPEDQPQLSRRLDSSVLSIPEVALGAAEQTLRDIAAVALTQAEAALSTGRLPEKGHAELLAAQQALLTTHQFLGRIEAGGDTTYASRLALLHAGDHLGRLLEACLEVGTEETGLVLEGQEGAALREASGQASVALSSLQSGLAVPEADLKGLRRSLKQASRQQAELRKQSRKRLLKLTAGGERSPEDTGRELSSMRWVDRVCYHSWRFAHHLSRLGQHQTLPESHGEDGEQAENEAASRGSTL